MPEVQEYAASFYPMTWLGAKGYPEQANGGRCYITGVLGQLRLMGEPDVLFADGITGDGFSFRWCPDWGCPAFNGGKGAFHEIWEYGPRILGFKGHWKIDHEDGWDEAWAELRALIDRGIPVQVGTHYSLILPYGAPTSPRLASTRGRQGSGHHVVIAGYDLQAGTVSVYEPNDLPEYARFDCPIDVFRQAWEESAQRVGNRYKAWVAHKPFNGEWTLHDGYGPYLMVWVEPGRDPGWDIAEAIRDSFPRNLKILRGDYPKPYALFGNQWQIPHWETGAPGMAVCAEAIRQGKLGDVSSPDGKVLPLFSEANIPNHGVLGRQGAAGYLARTAIELGKRGLDNRRVEAAAAAMSASSDLFRELRYETHLPRAGEILAAIAGRELEALAHMEAALPTVRSITAAGEPSALKASA